MCTPRVHKRGYLKKTNKKNMKRLIFPSYLSVIKNSIGSNMFRNFYVMKDGEKKDAMKDGELSCAFHTSSILFLFNLISNFHGTVEGTLFDMKKNGWEKTEKLKTGAVILWEKKDHNDDNDFHFHIGFFIGGDQAVSNSYERKIPFQHHYNYNGKRKIERIFWNSILNDDES